MAKGGDKPAIAMKALLEGKLLPHLNQALPCAHWTWTPTSRRCAATVPADRQAHHVHRQRG